MSRLISNFSLVLSRPGLYAGGTTVEHLAHYVRGYLRGVEDFSSAPSPEGALMDEFEGWLCRRLEVLRQGWHKAIAGKWAEPERGLAILREGFAEFVRQTGQEVTEYVFDRPQASARLADQVRQNALGLVMEIRGNWSRLLDRPAIDLLKAFHYGYDFGWADTCGVSAIGPAPYAVDEFAVWFNAHYESASTAGFAYAIRERSRSDEEAFRLFWHYFDEFQVHRALDPSHATVPAWGTDTFFRLRESITVRCGLSVERLAGTALIRVTVPAGELARWADAFARMRGGFDIKVSLIGDGGQEVVVANQRDCVPGRLLGQGDELVVVLNEWNVERVEEFFLRHLHDAKWKPTSVAVLCPGQSGEWSECYRGEASAVLFIQVGR